MRRGSGVRRCGEETGSGACRVEILVWRGAWGVGCGVVRGERGVGVRKQRVGCGVGDMGSTVWSVGELGSWDLDVGVRKDTESIARSQSCLLYACESAYVSVGVRRTYLCDICTYVRCARMYIVRRFAFLWLFVFKKNMGVHVQL